MEPKDWIVLIDKIVEVSPYLLLVLAITAAYYFIFKLTIKAYKELVETTVKSLQKGNDQVIAALKDAYKDMKGGR